MGTRALLCLGMALTACEASPAGSGPFAEDAGETQHEQFDAQTTARPNRQEDAPPEENSTEIDARVTMADEDARAETGTRTRSDASHSADASSASDASTPSPGETVFVSVGSSDNTPWLYTSCDGRAWTRRLLDLPADQPMRGLRGVAYGAGTFVITGGGSLDGRNVRLIGRSEDALNWQWEQRPLACSDCQWLGGAAFLDDGAQGIWIAGGGTGTRLYSRDGGRSWQTSSAQGLSAYRRFRSAGARAVGAGEGVLTVVELAAAGASEPVVWRDSAQPIAHESVFIAAGNGTFVVVWHENGCLFLGADGSWQSCRLPSERDPVITSVVFAADKFTILGRGAPLESRDGQEWKLAAGPRGSDFRDVVHGAGVYATPRQHSVDAANWQSANPSAESGTALAVGTLATGLRCPR